MEWLLCNCGLPAGLEGSATDSSAPEELDDTLEVERQERRSRRGDGDRERRRRRRRDGDRRDKRDKPRRRPSKDLEKSVSFEDESPVGVEALQLSSDAARTASSPRARERWITGSWTVSPKKKGPSPLLVETPQAQPSMKPSVGDGMRRKKYLATKTLMKGNQNFGPITPPPRSGEPPMWQATAVAAPLTIDGARNFRELLRTMRVDDLLRMDSYRNSALAYFASRDCVKGCNLVLRFADENARGLLAARPNLYGLTALDYARHHHRRGSSIMAGFRHYGADRCVYKREEN